MECSYCSIKTAIGKLRSKPIESILDDFRDGIERGYKNFQLVGDNAGSYGLDIKTHLGRLLTRISEIEGDFKLDLTDINPAYLHLILDPALELASEGRISRLYVPIQSGSSRILKLMKRGCDVEAVKVALGRIKDSIPNGVGFKLGTSVIVGFPTETDEELRKTIEFCQDVKFDWVWCHSFSVRPETPAAKMGGQLGADEILGRANILKKELFVRTLVTTAEDTAGSRTCQG